MGETRLAQAAAGRQERVCRVPHRHCRVRSDTEVTPALSDNTLLSAMTHDSAAYTHRSPRRVRLRLEVLRAVHDA